LPRAFFFQLRYYVLTVGNGEGAPVIEDAALWGRGPVPYFTRHDLAVECLARFQRRGRGYQGLSIWMLGILIQASLRSNLDQPA
jgi:hypothetical protein